MTPLTKGFIPDRRRTGDRVTSLFRPPSARVGLGGGHFSLYGGGGRPRGLSSMTRTGTLCTLRAGRGTRRQLGTPVTRPQISHLRVARAVPAAPCRDESDPIVPRLVPAFPGDDGSAIPRADPARGPAPGAGHACMTRRGEIRDGIRSADYRLSLTARLVRYEHTTSYGDLYRTTVR